MGDEKSIIDKLFYKELMKIVIIFKPRVKQLYVYYLLELLKLS